MSSSRKVYELFYDTLEPLVFPITEMLNDLGKQVGDITEIYFGLKEDRDDADDSLESLYMTTGGIVIDSEEMTIQINVQDFNFDNLQKGGTYEACFAIQFTGESLMREERITLYHDNKPLTKVHITPDSVRA